MRDLPCVAAVATEVYEWLNSVSITCVLVNTGCLTRGLIPSLPRIDAADVA